VSQATISRLSVTVTQATATAVQAPPPRRIEAAGPGEPKERCLPEAPQGAKLANARAIEVAA
jgi:hypothetical protein